MIKFSKQELLTQKEKQQIAQALKERGISFMNMNQELNNLYKKILNRAEFEISDDFRYREIIEDVTNKSSDYYAKAISFSIEQHPEIKNKHLLTVSMLHPSMKKQTSLPLCSGNKDEIIKYIKSSNFNTEISKNLKTLSDTLKEI